MEWWKLVILGIIAVVFVWGFYIVMVEKSTLNGELAELRKEVEILEDENRGLELDVEYFSHAENLVKELKSKFNYREEGEHLIILVPRDASSSNALENSE